MIPGKVLLAVFASALFGAACSRSSVRQEGSPPPGPSPTAGGATAARASSLKLGSSAFAALGKIPKLHSCEGSDQSPPLTIEGVPEGAKSLALIVDDPDAPDPSAPKRTWAHWVVYNLSPTTHALVEGAATPPGALDGKNDWGTPGYKGPCPPIGRHRYFHKLYALDTVLPDLGIPTKARLEEAMKGHVLASAELVGTYQKGD